MQVSWRTSSSQLQLGTDNAHLSTNPYAGGAMRKYRHRAQPFAAGLIGVIVIGGLALATDSS
jgi:hypothetical protein